MTKAEVVAEIAQRTGIEKISIQETVETFMDVLKDSLAKGENVYLRGFGSFIIKRRAEKTGRDPGNCKYQLLQYRRVDGFLQRDRGRRCRRY